MCTVSSQASGLCHRQAHGADALDRIPALWRVEQSAHFDDRERAEVRRGRLPGGDHLPSRKNHA